MTRNLAPRSGKPMHDRATRLESAARVRRARNELGLTREQCAEAVGCSVRALAYWENGKKSPPLDALVALESLALKRAA